MTAPRTGAAPTVLRRVLGRRLGLLRERAGLSVEAAAAELGVNGATVRRIEKAETGLKPPYVEKLLAVYGVPAAEVDRFLGLTREANRPGWWHAYRDVLEDWAAAHASLESAADRIRAYEPHQVPDLLQTRDYAAAALRGRYPAASDAEIARRGEFRERRRRALFDGRPGVYWVVVEESALRRTVGGPAVMRAQLEHLAGVVRAGRVVLQVLPFSAGPHPAMLGPFVVFRLPVPEIPDVAYAEHLAGAAYFDDEPAVAVFRAALDRAAVLASPASATPSLLDTIARR